LLKDNNESKIPSSIKELLAKLLFGIETVSPKEQKRMVNLACKEAVEWHEKQIVIRKGKYNEID